MVISLLLMRLRGWLKMWFAEWRSKRTRRIKWSIRAGHITFAAGTAWRSFGKILESIYHPNPRKIYTRVDAEAPD
jgi:hypothetical protein